VTPDHCGNDSRRPRAAASRRADADRRQRGPKRRDADIPSRPRSMQDPPRDAGSVGRQPRARPTAADPLPTAAEGVATARADTAFDIVTRPARLAVPATIKNESPVSSAPAHLARRCRRRAAGATVIAKASWSTKIAGDPPAIAADAHPGRWRSLRERPCRPGRQAMQGRRSPSPRRMSRKPSIRDGVRAAWSAPAAGALLRGRTRRTRSRRAWHCQTSRGNGRARSCSRSSTWSGARRRRLSALKQARDASSVIVRVVQSGRRRGAGGDPSTCPGRRRSR